MNKVNRIQDLLRCGLCLVVAAAWIAAGSAPAAAQSAAATDRATPKLPATLPKLEAAYWREPIFLIPYRFAPNQPLADQVDKIRLLVAEEAAGNWTYLEEGEPHLQGFKYHAPRDGEYWFAVQLVDRRGHAWPSGTVTPQLRVVVDTTPPQLKIMGFSDAGRTATLRYDVADPNLDPESLSIEVNAGDQWIRLPTPTPEVRRSDRLVGRVQWTPPADVEQIAWRAAIADRAKNRTADQSTTDLPADRSPVNSLRLPTQAADRPPVTGPALEWPADRTAQPGVATPGVRPVELPPAANPYSSRVASDTPRVPAQFAADHPNTERPAADPFRPDVPPTDAMPRSDRGRPAVEGPSSSPADWTPVDRTSPEPAADRVVNSATFEVEYDVQSVGRYGVARVALWGSRDGGQTWRSYAVDDDNRSPIRVTTPGGGVYGFRLVIDGANGATAPKPQSGDPPEITVQVDLVKPTAELLAASLGPDHLSDHLLIRWSAADTNLLPRPIGLFYSTYADGPWSTAATDLENTGQFAWRIERHIPERFFLRLEARDLAGNVTSATTPTPIVLNRPQPQGRLKNVRPVTGDATPLEMPFSTQPAQQRQPARQPNPPTSGPDQTARAAEAGRR